MEGKGEGAKGYFAADLIVWDEEFVVLFWGVSADVFLELHHPRASLPRSQSGHPLEPQAVFGDAENNKAVQSHDKGDVAEYPAAETIVFDGRRGLNPVLTTDKLRDCLHLVHDRGD